MKQFHYWIDWGTGHVTVEAENENEARDFADNEVRNNLEKYMPFNDFTLDLVENVDDEWFEQTKEEV